MCQYHRLPSALLCVLVWGSGRDVTVPGCALAPHQPKQVAGAGQQARATLGECSEEKQPGTGIT